jgi:pimeloyl-ACP methyl ester carboxylesterase
MKSQTTFVLIHGGINRSWHWRLVQSRLEGMGHRTIAPDLPMDDNGAGVEVWSDVVSAAMSAARVGDEAIIVGHSMGGLLLPVLASRTRVGHLVFLAGNVPLPGVSYDEYSKTQDAMVVPWDRLQFDDQDRVVVSWDLGREVFYPDVEESLARAAYEHGEPMSTTSLLEECPITAWPDVPSTYVLCADDLVVGTDWSRRVSLERLGRAAIEIPGSHSAILSQPDVVANTLSQIARETTAQ